MKFQLTILSLLVFSNSLLFSQTNSDSSVVIKKIEKHSSEPSGINIIKFNLAGVVLNNYSFQYERFIKKKMSLALSARFMPYSTIPIKQLVRDYMGNDNPDSYGIIDRFKVSNFSFTPEVRFYLGQGNGRGFYIAPFYRFSRFRSEDLTIYYQDKNTLEGRSVNFKGNLSGHTIGVLAGAQWRLGKHFALDWSIAGPHFGVSNGNFAGITNFALTAADRTEIERQINNLDVPLTKITYEYPSPNVARLKFNGPWGGIRVGLGIGFVF